MVLSLISFLLTLCGFLYGAFFVLRSGKPLYFKLLIASAGCLVIERLALLVNYLTDGNAAVTLGELGIFASLLFLLSAEFGALDRLVDDGVGTAGYRFVSLAAPALCLFALFCLFRGACSAGLPVALLKVLILLPAVPASYFTLKHLLLPTDAVGFLKTTRLTNLGAMLYYLFLLAAAVAGLYDNLWESILSVPIALISAWISVNAVRGERIWKQSI